MKTSDSTLRALLHGSTSAAFTNLVTLVTKAGTTVRWTAGAFDIVWSGNTYTAGGSGTAPIVQPMRIREAMGLEVSTLDLNLDCGTSAQIGGVALQLAALNGVLDDARVTVHRAYMVTQGGPVVGAIHRFAGVVSDCEVDSYAVRLRVQSDLYKLDEMLPRHLIREKCSWALGDAGCGVNLASIAVASAIATPGTTASYLRTTELSGSPFLDRFTGGKVTFTSGTCSGLSRTVKKQWRRGAPPFDTVDLELEVGLPSTPANGDTITITPACDKTSQRCLVTFSGNVKTNPPFTRRRGFDFVPPPDMVTR